MKRTVSYNSRVLVHLYIVWSHPLSIFFVFCSVDQSSPRVVTWSPVITLSDTKLSSPPVTFPEISPGGAVISPLPLAHLPRPLISFSDPLLLPREFIPQSLTPRLFFLASLLSCPPAFVLLLSRVFFSYSSVLNPGSIQFTLSICILISCFQFDCPFPYFHIHSLLTYYNTIQLPTNLFLLLVIYFCTYFILAIIFLIPSLSNL